MYSNFDELTEDCLMHYQRKGAKWGQHKFGEWQEQAGYANGRPDPNAKVRGGQIPNVKIGIPTARQQLALHERVKGQMGQPLANGIQTQRGLVNGRVAPPMPAGTPTASDLRGRTRPPMPAGTPTPSDSIYRRFDGSKLPSFGNGTTLQTSSGSSGTSGSSGSTSSSSDTKKKEEDKPTNSSSSSTTTTTTTTYTTTTGGGGNGGGSTSGSSGSSRRSSGSSGSSRRSSGSSTQQQTQAQPQPQPQQSEASLFVSDNAPAQKTNSRNARGIQNGRVRRTIPTQRGIQTGRSSSATPTQRGIQTGRSSSAAPTQRGLKSEVTKKRNRTIDEVTSDIDSKKIIGRSRALRGNRTFANDLNVAAARSRELRKRIGKSGIDAALEQLENAKKSNESKPKYHDVAKRRRRGLYTSVLKQSMQISDTTEAFDYLAHSYLEI